MWGATCNLQRLLKCPENFNPRAPCGARRAAIIFVDLKADISIHAPRVGRDVLTSFRLPSDKNFNPRAPCGARPCIPVPRCCQIPVFQSTRPVWGATVNVDPCVSAIIKFQSTRPVWGATDQFIQRFRVDLISIHAPRVGRDACTVAELSCVIGFQSTRPVWGATANLTILPRQICTKGTKEFLLGRKTHEKKEK